MNTADPPANTTKMSRIYEEIPDPPPYKDLIVTERAREHAYTGILTADGYEDVESAHPSDLKLDENHEYIECSDLSKGLGITHDSRQIAMSEEGSATAGDYNNTQTGSMVRNYESKIHRMSTDSPPP